MWNLSINAFQGSISESGHARSRLGWESVVVVSLGTL